VEAVRRGSFQVFAVESVDQGIEILTGRKAGKRLPSGEFEKGSVNWLAEERLRGMADRIRSYSRAVKQDSGRKLDAN